MARRKPRSIGKRVAARRKRSGVDKAEKGLILGAVRTIKSPSEVKKGERLIHKHRKVRRKKRSR